jgi:hypothetical protein
LALKRPQRKLCLSGNSHSGLFGVLACRLLFVVVAHSKLIVRNGVCVVLQSCNDPFFLSDFKIQIDRFIVTSDDNLLQLVEMILLGHSFVCTTTSSDLTELNIVTCVSKVLIRCGRITEGKHQSIVLVFFSTPCRSARIIPCATVRLECRYFPTFWYSS